MKHSIDLTPTHGNRHRLRCTVGTFGLRYQTFPNDDPFCVHSMPSDSVGRP